MGANLLSFDHKGDIREQIRVHKRPQVRHQRSLRDFTRHVVQREVVYHEVVESVRAVIPAEHVHRIVPNHGYVAETVAGKRADRLNLRPLARV